MTLDLDHTAWQLRECTAKTRPAETGEIAVLGRLEIISRLLVRDDGDKKNGDWFSRDRTLFGVLCLRSLRLASYPLKDL